MLFGTCGNCKREFKLVSEHARACIDTGVCPACVAKIRAYRKGVNDWNVIQYCCVPDCFNYECIPLYSGDRMNMFCKHCLDALRQRKGTPLTHRISMAEQIIEFCRLPHNKRAREQGTGEVKAKWAKALAGFHVDEIVGEDAVPVVDLVHVDSVLDSQAASDVVDLAKGDKAPIDLTQE